MYGNDVNLVLEKRFEDRLQFVFSDCKISIHNGVVIAAGKRGPRVHANPLADGNAVHFCRATTCEFYHSVFPFTLYATDHVNGAIAGGVVAGYHDLPTAC